MKKIIIFILIVWLVVIIFFIKDYFYGKQYNKYRCETKKEEIIGVISWVNKKTNYSQIRLRDGEKVYSFDINKIEFRRGFPKWVSYKIGDSIIKAANSKNLLIENQKLFFNCVLC